MRSLFPKNIAKICIRDWDKYGGRVLGELFLETKEILFGNCIYNMKHIMYNWLI